MRKQLITFAQVIHSFCKISSSRGGEPQLPPLRTPLFAMALLPFQVALLATVKNDLIIA